MRDSYPFKGVWRWAVLPSLLALGGGLDGLLEGVRTAQPIATFFMNMLLFDGVKGAIEGVAVAIGRRVLAGVAVALVLGAMSGWSYYSMDPRQTTLGHAVASAGGPAVMVLGHHGYLRARVRWRRGWMLGGVVYPAASAGGYGLFVGATGDLNMGVSGFAIWALEEGLTSWLALALALRLAERAAPAPTPPAPNA